jgi:hypothetical protein
LAQHHLIDLCSYIREWPDCGDQDRAGKNLNSINVDEGIAVALDAILNDRLVLLAGAGLSMAPPSNLPSAWRLAEGARTKYAAQYGATRPPLSYDIEEQAEFFSGAENWRRPICRG